MAVLSAIPNGNFGGTSWGFLASRKRDFTSGVRCVELSVSVGRLALSVRHWALGVER